MRWKMPNVTVVAATTAVLVLLAAAETAFAIGGTAGGGGGGVSGGSVTDGSGGVDGGGRQRRAAAAAAIRLQQGIPNGNGASVSVDRSPDVVADVDDVAPEIPAAVQCSNCLAHESIRSLSIELIKMSILNKLGMQRPPEFGGRRPPKVPTDLPPLQDLMQKYNGDRSSSVVVMPHIRHKSHHTEASGDGGGGYGSDMQSDEAANYATAAVTSAMDNVNMFTGGGDDEEDDYHVKAHKLIAFAQPRKYDFEHCLRCHSET